MGANRIEIDASALRLFVSFLIFIGAGMLIPCAFLLTSDPPLSRIFIAISIAAMFPAMLIGAGFTTAMFWSALRFQIEKGVISRRGVFQLTPPIEIDHIERVTNLAGVMVIANPHRIKPTFIFPGRLLLNRTSRSKLSEYASSLPKDHSLREIWM